MRRYQFHYLLFQIGHPGFVFSFATVLAQLAGDKIPVQMLQKLYHHSDLKTTIGYQSGFIHRETDEALDMVAG